MQQQQLHGSVAIQLAGNGQIVLSGESEVMLSLVSGEPRVDSLDEANGFKVSSMISMKLQKPDALKSNSIYARIAQKIVERAESENWSVPDLEKGIEKYLFTKQYGERVEIADFFDNHEPEKLYPYSWMMMKINKGENSQSDFDGYMIENCPKMMVRIHDGKKLKNLTLTMWQGLPVRYKTDLAVSNVGVSPKPAPESTLGGKNDDLTRQLNALLVKQQKELFEKDEIIEKLNKRIVNLQLRLTTDEFERRGLISWSNYKLIDDRAMQNIVNQFDSDMTPVEFVNALREHVRNKTGVTPTAMEQWLAPEGTEQRRAQDRLLTEIKYYQTNNGGVQ